MSEPASSEMARQHAAQRRWRQAYEAFRELDESDRLAQEDWPSYAQAAALCGHIDVYLAVFERLYQHHLDAGRTLEAGRAAYWIGFGLAGTPERARAGAWFMRSQRLVDSVGQDVIEHGYLLLPVALRHFVSGQFAEAAATARRALALGERFSNWDVIGMGQNLLGRALLRSGQFSEGLAILDESMLVIERDEMTPLVAGVMYCSMIESCQRIFAFEQAREWTRALHGWCEAQPELVNFRGRCQVHRAEIFQMAGDFQQALEQTERALAGGEREAMGPAWYQKGEIHRLRGERDAAEHAYEQASQSGCDPQPGLALLRASEGKLEVASAALRRAAAEAPDCVSKSKVLPALLEVSLLCGSVDDARQACAELERAAVECPVAMLEALAAQARGRVLLAEGDASSALGPLRRACFSWQRLEAPYFEARARLELGKACEALGDLEGCRQLHDAARATFERLGAAFDEMGKDFVQPAPAPAHNLTARELEVLRELATGKTNKEIAVHFSLSEKTVDRHVSNLFAKLGVSTRAAATAWAYQQHLV